MQGKGLFSTRLRSPMRRFLLKPATHGIHTRSSMNFQSIEDVRHSYVKKDFERQVFGRLGTLPNLSRCSVIAAKEDFALTVAEIREMCFAELPYEKESFGGIFAKKKWGKATTDGKSREGKDVLYECDLLFRVDSTSEESFSLQDDLFKDVCDFSTLLNPGVVSSAPDPLDRSLDIYPGDLIIGEIAETPASLKEKLWQVERSFRLLKLEGEVVGTPRVGIVCLNGERNIAERVSEYVRTQFVENQLKSWSILHEIPVYVIWTPYRNVFGSIKDLNERMDGMNDRMDGMQKEMNDRMDGMQKEMNDRMDGMQKEMNDRMDGMNDRMDVIIDLLKKKN